MIKTSGTASQAVDYSSAKECLV